MKEDIYKDLSKSNLNNILRDIAPMPDYIEYINKVEYNEYTRPLFIEHYPSKKDIINPSTLSKYYKKIIDNIIEHQFDNIEY